MQHVKAVWHIDRHTLLAKYYVFQNSHSIVTRPFPNLTAGSGYESIYYIYIQWNPSNSDTSRTEESVCISEVSLFQGLNFLQEMLLGKENVSLLERCPHRGVQLYLIISVFVRPT